MGFRCLKVIRNLRIGGPVILAIGLHYLLTAANSKDPVFCKAMRHHGINRHKPASACRVINSAIFIPKRSMVLGDNWKPTVG